MIKTFTARFNGKIYRAKASAGYKAAAIIGSRLGLPRDSYIEVRLPNRDWTWYDYKGDGTAVILDHAPASTTETRNVWQEYDAAAEWCAKRGIKGKFGDALPENLSTAVAELINEDPEAFEERVRATAYALAMEKIHEGGAQ